MRAAFISGAGRNNGRAMALELARRGCNVAINGRRNREICDAVAREVTALGVEAAVLMGDVGDAADAARLAAAALERFATIDILVNNAAIRPHVKFLEITDADWHRVFNTDLHASFYLSRAFLPGMCAQRWGRIVNMTGRNAIAGEPERAHVAAAKHGVWGLTKALAREFGPQGVTVNAISPWMIARDSAASGTADGGFDATINPLGRQGTTAEVAALCAFLCSEEAGYISGQMIGANGAAAT